MAQRNYANVRLLIDGSYQQEASSVSIDFQGGMNPVDVLEGRGGYNEGPGFATITVTQAVPIGGLEFNFTRAIKNRSVHQVQMFCGGQSYTGKGVFLNGSVGQSTGAATEANYTFEGDLEEMS